MRHVVPIRDGLAVEFKMNSLVIQPTSLCNMDCTYCYLPLRKQNLVMPQTTALRIAETLADFGLPDPIRIIWHSGEPLAVGVDRFDALVSCFEPLRERNLVRHSIQTNGTLIDAEWCDLFRAYEFTIGVSLDGPRDLTRYRVDWKGRQTYDRIIAGIECLREAGLSFGTICVVSRDSLHRGKELYAFFRDLGCQAAAFNIVEEEGVNKNLLVESAEAETRAFWTDLLDAWLLDPSMEVREFRKVAVWLHSEIAEKQSTSVVKDLIPSIAHNGDVVLVSPEFMGVTPHSTYESFVVGNVHRISLSDCIRTGIQTSYMRDFVAGIDMCEKACSYFGYCRGGDASNKYFERGTLATTETNYCRNTRQGLIDVVMDSLRPQATPSHAPGRPITDTPATR